MSVNYTIDAPHSMSRRGFGYTFTADANTNAVTRTNAVILPKWGKKERKVNNIYSHLGNGMQSHSAFETN